jgi:hypothetical protein
LAKAAASSWCSDSGSVEDPSQVTPSAAKAGPEKAKLKTSAKILLDRELTNLIATVEFGDWLIGERTDEPVTSLYEKVENIRQSLTRSETLRIAETVLFEFLTLQHAMLEKAEKARASY